MKENSFLPSEEPQEQHQGEGAQGILWRNLLSSITQLSIVRSSWNLLGISHFWLSTSFVNETFRSNPQGILENNIQVTLDNPANNIRHEIGMNSNFMSGISAVCEHKIRHMHGKRLHFYLTFCQFLSWVTSE